MKLTIKGIDEKSFAVVGRPSDSIIDIKRTIQSLKKSVPPSLSLKSAHLLIALHRSFSVPIDQQRLLFFGKELQDDQTLGSYDIQNDSILHLAVRMLNGIQVVVKIKDRSTTITILPSDTSKSIKFVIQGSEGYVCDLASQE